jgi:hypothetical protein
MHTSVAIGGSFRRSGGEHHRHRDGGRGGPAYVYRRFASREELLAVIHEARLAAIERPTKEARLRETPVTVALHRCAEGLIEATAPGRST